MPSSPHGSSLSSSIDSSRVPESGVFPERFILPEHPPLQTIENPSTCSPSHSDGGYQLNRSDGGNQLSRSVSTDNIYVNSFRFNQDGSCFAASTTEGFRVFTCSPLSEFARREIGSSLVFQHSNNRRVNLIAMLYRSHSFAFVTHKEPKKVQVGIRAGA